MFISIGFEWIVLGVILLLFSSCILLYSLYRILINIFSKRKYRDCARCEHFKFYSTWSAGDGADYRCTKRNKIWAVDNLTHPYHEERCEYYLRKDDSDENKK